MKVIELPEIHGGILLEQTFIWTLLKKSFAQYTQLKLMRPVTDEIQSVDRTIHQENFSTFLCIKIRPYFHQILIL